MLGVESLDQAKLHSERIRLTLLLGFLGVIALLGIVRVIHPVPEAEGVGPVVLAITMLALLYESGLLVALRRGRDPGIGFWRANAVFEGLLPAILGLASLAGATFEVPLILVGPVYGMLFVLIALSVLRLDPLLVGLTGLSGVAGYLCLMVVALSRRQPGKPLPVPPLQFAVLFVVLVIGAAVAVFVTRRMLEYVRGAVRELESRRQREKLERDLEMARDIQRGLLPDSMPELPDFDLAAMSRPADQTGGDYYDWQPLAGGRVVLSLGDVTGHGVGPALVTAACRAYMRCSLGHEEGPAAAIQRVNQLLHHDVPSGKFVTFALLDLDPERHRGVFLSAGHGPSFFVKAESGEVTSVLSQGTPLAILPVQVLQAAVELDFEPGDLLIILSDGFFEWENADGEEFGLERLQAVIRRARAGSAEEIIAALDRAVLSFVGDQLQPDDMTALVVKRLLDSGSTQPSRP